MEVMVRTLLQSVQKIETIILEKSKLKHTPSMKVTLTRLLYILYQIPIHWKKNTMLQHLI